MPKTISIDDKTHILIKEKELELEKKYGHTIRISAITGSIIRNNLDKVEEYLGLNKVEGKI